MKYIWEPSDIKPGQKFKVKDSPEIWMIGYTYDHKGNKCYFTVSLTDGLMGTGNLDSAENIAHFLTSASCKPLPELTKQSKKN